MIKVQSDDFSVQNEYDALRARSGTKAGAICMFTGLVREFGDHSGVEAIELQHYPGMTEKSLQGIVDNAAARWELIDTVVVHRVGRLKLSDQIVLVGVSASHRGVAFEACEFIMDYLKHDAPFWKKEITATDSKWVEAKDSDSQRYQSWKS